MLGMSLWMWASNGRDTIAFGGPWGSSDYNTLTGVWKNYIKQDLKFPGTISEFPGSMVEYAAADLDGRMWYGFYESGVSCRERDGSLTHYTVKDGLPNGSVWGIWADDDGTMWFNTFSGTCHFDPKAFVRRQSHQSPKAVALAFLDAIKRQSYDALRPLMSVDHVAAFNEEETKGAANLKKAWIEWWQMVPDLQIDVVKVHEADEKIVIQLTSKGTYAVKGGRKVKGDFSYPLIAIATVRGGKVAEWREFGDFSSLDKLLK
jgi:ketosteroid isomerase-like protein